MGYKISTARFGYQPLFDSRDIRVLHVLPGKVSDNICCEIHYENLNKAPIYEALSYTWHCRTLADTRIRCDGKTLTVTKNLDNALRALRFVDRTRVLWVDRVCINQDDPREKREQISMMNDIYRRAEGVVAWVGEEERKDQAALDVEKYLNIPLGDWPSRGELQAWRSLTNFINRPWFSRVWVVQELAVAKKLTIYCGQRQMEWDILRRGLIRFLDRMWLFLNTSNVDLSLERVFTLLGIRNLVTKNSEEQEELEGRFYQFPLSQIDDTRSPKEVKTGDLLHFVKGTRLFRSTEPSDHIFALLGLVLEKDSKEIGKEIKITYSKDSFRDVFREFVRVMIVQHGTLDVLSQAGLHDTLPSWVPDWTVPPISYPLITRAYSASGNTTVDGVNYSGSAFQEVLPLRGKVVDTVESLMPGFVVNDKAKSKVFELPPVQILKVTFLVMATRIGKNLLKPFQAIPIFGKTPTLRIAPEVECRWHQVAQLCEGGYSSGQDLELAYIQTLIGNLPFKQLGSSHEALARDCFLIWREWLSEIHILSRGFPSSGSWARKTKLGATPINVPRKLMELFSLHQESCLSKERVRNVKWGIGRMFSRAVERMARNRQFCRTRKRYMGWVPFETQGDDVICVLEGGRVPYVLRPEVGGTRQYKFVGEAYIHGLMHGKGLMEECEVISLI